MQRQPWGTDTSSPAASRGSVFIRCVRDVCGGRHTLVAPRESSTAVHVQGRNLHRGTLANDVARQYDIASGL